jgi:DNA polymerase I
VAVDRALAGRDDIRMLLQVHDELIFEVDEASVTEAAALIRPLMENVAALKVPVVVDVKVGKNWGEMSKLE